MQKFCILESKKFCTAIFSAKFTVNTITNERCRSSASLKDLNLNSLQLFSAEYTTSCNITTYESRRDSAEFLIRAWNMPGINQSLDIKLEFFANLSLRKQPSLVSSSQKHIARSQRHKKAKREQRRGGRKDGHYINFFPLINIYPL